MDDPRPTTVGPLPRDQAAALHRRLDQRSYATRAAERRRELKARAAYATGAVQLIIVLCYGVFGGVWEWPSVILVITVCLLLIIAGLNDGRLW